MGEGRGESEDEDLLDVEIPGLNNDVGAEWGLLIPSPFKERVRRLVGSLD